jgi:Gpi18-like mannosyltransferase
LIEHRAKPQPKFLLPVLMGILLLLNVLLRIITLPIPSPDMYQYLLKWVEILRSHGGFAGLAIDFSDYNPPYLYLLTLIAYLPPGQAMFWIKIASALMDFALAGAAFGILRALAVRRDYAAVGAILLLFAPSVWSVSSVWGQCDGFYTFFLLLTILALLSQRPYAALAAFTLALSFKLQSVFLAPLLLVLLLRRQIPWKSLLVVIPVYLLALLPAALAGRSWFDLLTIYFNQANNYDQLTLNAPNLYAFIPPWYYHPVVYIGIALAGLVCLGLVFWLARREQPFFRLQLMAIAAAFLFIVPYLLPKMHERYFFAAAAAYLTLSIADRRFWPVAAGLQITNTIPYFYFINGANAPAAVLIPLAVLQTALLGFSLYRTHQLLAVPPAPAAV